ncbi:MAG TPA: HlyD family type I secretion periplasmic adaptor subunit [Ramlibacter sp.]|nr:HlyD family type I secretion periplasmic adaptor subunit [Ramlibacter sp.]
MAQLPKMIPLPDPAPSGPAQEPAANEPAAPDDPRRVRRIGIAVLATGFVGFLAWAAFAPLDEGVPSAGVVAIDTKRKAVQHLTGGIVKAVLVREGDRVREGQPLVRLDDAAMRANFESVRHRYLGLRAAQGRLLAERAGSNTITYHPELESEASDPLIRLQMTTQEQLFRARRAALAADLRALQESIEGQQAVLTSLQTQLTHRRAQLDLLNEELRNTRGLVEEGFAPRNRQLELERMAAEAQASIADLTGGAQRALRTIAEMRQRQALRRQEDRKEVETQHAEVAREVEADESKYRALREELGRVDIKSPATGQVVGLSVQTVGGVISPGQKLMDIVPEGERLMLESRVPPHLIDRVHAGLPVDVRFAAFAHSPQLVVDGELVSISGDLLTEPQTNTTYYLARVALTPEGLRHLGARTLQPGMPVEVVLKTGERSLLAYLLHPLSRRMAASMKEE